MRDLKASLHKKVKITTAEVITFQKKYAIGKAAEVI